METKSLEYELDRFKTRINYLEHSVDSVTSRTMQAHRKTDTIVETMASSRTAMMDLERKITELEYKISHLGDEIKNKLETYGAYIPTKELIDLLNKEVS